jgi:hypothetical protein
MGSHVSGIEEVLIGSNTEKVVRLSEVPVLVIKRNKPIERTSFSHLIFERNKKPFKKMLNLAKYLTQN